MKDELIEMKDDLMEMKNESWSFLQDSLNSDPEKTDSPSPPNSPIPYPEKTNAPTPTK